jgi:hypothetical protein
MDTETKKILDASASSASEQIKESRKRKRAAPKASKCSVALRLGLDETEFQKVPNKEPFINKMLLNQVYP